MSRSKGFSESARKLGISRQAVQQAQRAKDGLCTGCGKTAVKGKSRCKECLAVRAEQARTRRQNVNAPELESRPGRATP